MIKKITNNTDTPQGYYDDGGLRIVQPGESIILHYADPPVQIIVARLEDLSNPPPGFSKIKNFYVDLEKNKTIVEFKDELEEELEEE